MLRGELVHKRIAYLSGRVDSSDRRSKRARKCPWLSNGRVTGPRVNRGREPGRWIQTLRTSKIRRPCQRSHFKLLNECLLYSFPHYAVTNCITKPMLISFAIRNSEVSAIESSKCIGIYGDAFRSA